MRVVLCHKKKGFPKSLAFFLWHNTTRMHVFTFLAAKYKALK